MDLNAPVSSKTLALLNKLTELTNRTCGTHIKLIPESPIKDGFSKSICGDESSKKSDVMPPAIDIVVNINDATPSCLQDVDNKYQQSYPDCAANRVEMFDTQPPASEGPATCIHDVGVSSVVAKMDVGAPDMANHSNNVSVIIDDYELTQAPIIYDPLCAPIDDAPDIIIPFSAPGDIVSEPSAPKYIDLTMAEISDAPVIN